MNREYPQISWDSQLEQECRQLVRLAVREDLEDGHDWTTLALVPEPALGRAMMHTREAGVVAGLAAVPVILDEMDTQVDWRPLVQDGHRVAPGQAIAELSGSARDLLTSERLVLNVVGRLSGIATLTHHYVERVAGGARIYDTRKTTPGWRGMEKYAVRCGGGWNHRRSLSSAVLIKDNHLAFFSQQGAAFPGLVSAAAALRAVRRFLVEASRAFPEAADLILEIEVDTLEQLQAVLPESPDIVLLDNMAPPLLAEAVRVRDEAGSRCQLEASGGVHLDSVAAIAASGVERISIGALTHSARCLDIGLDWALVAP